MGGRPNRRNKAGCVFKFLEALIDKVVVIYYYDLIFLLSSNSDRKQHQRFS